MICDVRVLRVNQPASNDKTLGFLNSKQTTTRTISCLVSKSSGQLLTFLTSALKQVNDSKAQSGDGPSSYGCDKGMFMQGLLHGVLGNTLNVRGEEGSPDKLQMT